MTTRRQSRTRARAVELEEDAKKISDTLSPRRTGLRTVAGVSPGGALTAGTRNQEAKFSRTLNKMNSEGLLD